MLKRLFFLAYLLLVVYIVFITGNDHRHLHLFSAANPINYIPLKAKIEYVTHGDVYEQGNLKFYIKEIVGNLLLLFPLPFFLVLGWRMASLKKIILLALAVSFSIEFTQFITGIGTADIDDLLLNTMGAALGAALALWLKKQPFWHPVQGALHLPG